MKFRLPFSIYNKYETDLSYTEIINTLENKKTEYYLNGLQIVKYNYNVTYRNILVQRYSEGLDVVIEVFPLVEMKIESENPTKLKTKIHPNYRGIIFLSIFTLVFSLASIFENRWTFNGVSRDPTILERFLFFFGGGIIPAVWCYLQFIRPIKKTEKWLIEKLKLKKSQNNVA
ncbi:hypothetical protein [Kaistella palustris]|uniref:hypothetical protein n=1 Tax=Kaistella palustris TaxID=493376 RepID=UPI00048686EC|nr:hypothetical protein [Kaistella palustris]